MEDIQYMNPQDSKTLSRLHMQIRIHAFKLERKREKILAHVMKGKLNA